MWRNSSHSSIQAASQNVINLVRWSEHQNDKQLMNMVNMVNDDTANDHTTVPLHVSVFT